MAFLRVSHLSLHEATHQALTNVSFSLGEGRRLAVAGETGAGKSTLLQSIAGLIQPTGGEIWLEERRVKGPQEQLMPGHPGVAYLSQHSELPKFLRVEQVLRYASTLPAPEAGALYQLCRIDHLLLRRTDQVSGGERQRIALARLLLARPRLLLLDEPFSNLDRGHKQLLQAVLHDVTTQLGLTTLLVSHDPQDTLSWADELLVLEKGVLVQQAAPETIYRQPVSAYVAGLFGEYSLLSAAASRRLTGDPGRRNRRLLVRPEQLQLAEVGTPALVQEVRFYGSYYEAQLTLAGQPVRLRTPQAGLQAGQTVSVALAAGAAWYV
ncbi:ABC transporter ATP-binding protein [Hymenobacter sp. BT18]|uniref:ATP-binding cassette domain-containing protein n=1 Tax=Hymenobacter sp. BT18 TaxID=2835648 RepID=UPI00143E41BA|nr:ATP-binding cassette domain-containing protein [Hymenobacter sp. BT18]QIX62813.1 ABC transporter ATP-binding protein [Hymenobacter sp. BT18]